MKQFTFTSKEIGLDHLLLDPNNYRFLDNPSYKRKLSTKYHLPEVQAATFRLLEQDKRYQLAELKRSILTNGYVPMERIIVVSYPAKRDRYLVVEGNRRVAALKSLLQENKEGVIELTKSQVSSYSRIPCAILNADEQHLPHAQRVIMGIRHIAGPREWGAYQQAQLIVELHEIEGQDFQSVADHLGISAMGVGRRYRAMKALREMETDELYAELANYEHYRLFIELVSLTDVREYFGWDEKLLKFSDVNKARQFFELIAPLDREHEPKIRTYADVRKLRGIFPYAKAVAILMDPERTLTDASEIAESLERERVHEGFSIQEIIVEINRAISKVDVLALKLLTKTDIKGIDDTIARLQQLKKVGQAATE